MCSTAKPPFNIVLVEPEIPRQYCQALRPTDSILLVDPLVSADDKHLKRAGLDYWYVHIVYWDNLEAFCAQDENRLFLVKVQDVTEALPAWVFLFSVRKPRGFPQRSLHSIMISAFPFPCPIRMSEASTWPWLPALSYLKHYVSRAEIAPNIYFSLPSGGNVIILINNHRKSIHFNSDFPVNE
jgi:tRNA(Leu) C34 or U34 (ribose-2'-O)-methylase TrmL